MKNLIMLCLVVMIGLCTNVFATEFATSKTSKDPVFTQTQKDVASVLQDVLLDVKKSGYSAEKVTYALDAVKFTTQIDVGSITSLIQPLISLLKAPIDIVKSIFPIIQGVVETLLSGASVMSASDVTMLKELNYALDSAIQSGYQQENVNYALDVFEKVLTQSNLSLDLVGQLITPIIDELRVLITTMPAIIPNIADMLFSVVSNMMSIREQFQGIGG